MNVEEKIKNLEKRIADLEARALPSPDKEEYSRGIRALADGDPAPLEQYLRRGGKVLRAADL